MGPRRCVSCLLCQGSSLGSQAKPPDPTAHATKDYLETSEAQAERRSRARSARLEISRTLSDHLTKMQKGEDSLVQTLQAGDPLTKSNVLTDLIVVRGKDWMWHEEDGGPGRPGRILSIDRVSATVTVHWKATGLVESHYRFGKRGKYDLAVVHGNSTEQSQSKLLAMFQRQLSNCMARNSQLGFADKMQTVIIFDWDDTLFPSTFVRSDARLNLNLPLREQKLSAHMKKIVFNSLATCAANAESLLRLATSFGKVILVTLARAPWVDDSCKLFYARIGTILKKLNVRVVYAQERCKINNGAVPSSMTAVEAEAFWSAVKGRAISEEVKRFYSKYEDQSWKNIISIGDSNFERLGTMKAAATYMRAKGIDVPEKLDNTIRNGLVRNPGYIGTGFQPNEASSVVVAGQTFHVRTKVLKMVDEPTVEELTVELGLVQQWLPLMVRHDGGFSVDLSGVQDWDQARAIEEALAARAAPTALDLSPATSSRTGGHNSSVYPSEEDGLQRGQIMGQTHSSLSLGSVDEELRTREAPGASIANSHSSSMVSVDEASRATESIQV